MGIFSKLIPLGKKTTSSAEQRVRSLLAGIDDSSALRTLKDIEDRFTEIVDVERVFGPEVAQSAFTQLDQRGHAAVTELLKESLSAPDPQTSAHLVWSALNSHTAELIAAHATFSAILIPLVQSEAERNRVARDAVAMLRSWALCKKLLHFRYQTPSATLWQQAHALLMLLSEHKLEQILVVPYPGESAVTPLREYLIGAYFECLPEGKLLAQQQEAMDRFLRSGDQLVFTSEPETNATHRVDLASANGPTPKKDSDKGGPSVRFLSTVRSHEQLVKLADALANQRDLPKWLSGVALNAHLKEATFRSVAQHWSARPPRRMSPRRNESRELRVAIGFAGAFRMINEAQEWNAVDFPSEATMPAELTANNPLELLQQMERTGRVPKALSLEVDMGKVNIENWQRADVSASGLSATLPALLPRHSVGALLTIRAVNDVHWRLGLIRRVARNAAKHPLIGVEIIDDDSSCAHANLIDSTQVWSEGVEASGWSNIIFLTREGHELLMPHGSFSSGKLVSVTQGNRNWHIRLESLLDRGPDYDRARFSIVV